MKYFLKITALSLLLSMPLSYAENTIVSVENKQNFEQLLANTTQPLVVLFHSGCPVCTVTKNHFTNMTSQYPTAITYIEVNVNKLHELAQTYDITSLPTILIFQAGSNKPTYKLIGPSEEELNSKINQVLKTK